MLGKIGTIFINASAPLILRGLRDRISGPCGIVMDFEFDVASILKAI
jgi:hypothetical protein